MSASRVVETTAELIGDVPTWTGPDARNIERAHKLFTDMMDGMFQDTEWVRMADEPTRKDCIDCAKELENG